MASTGGQRVVFYPKADAAVLSSRYGPPPAYPKSVGPIFDRDNVDRPLAPWSMDGEKSFYPPKADAYAPSAAPDKSAGMCLSDCYLRATLAKNERLRLSMFWYYTRDILNETEFLCGLQEKVCIAQESTGWEFAIIGILDVNFYIRLAALGVPLGILPRGETICAHTVTQPPGSVFLLPNMLEDWRFQKSPYVESGGLVAYAGAPLRLQNETGECVALGSLCVASSASQEPLTKLQQTTLVRLADWVVSDIVQCARARRQRDRRRMVELIAAAQGEIGDTVAEEPVLRILNTTYPGATISLQSSQALHIEVEGRGPILLSDLEDGLWEDVDYLDDFIANSNQRELPSARVVRVIAAKCESISGPSLLIVASKDLRLVFDDIDSWFVQTCASMLSQIWHKRLLGEVLRAKEKFLRGFSHQLRTPIHGILGSAELLAEEMKSWNAREGAQPPSALLEVTRAVQSGETFMYLDTIKRAGRDLISIINSMITLNRWADVAISDRHYATYTINELETELAKETFKTISGDTRYKASVFFNHDLPPDCYSLRIDLSLLRDSLLPLIINAIQNTAEGVVAVTVSIRSDSKELIVDVEDTGRGIPSDDQPRIFELYEKVDAYSTGAGLGLTLASKFAALLHGSIVLVSSEIDRGSHFRATFRDVELTRSALLSQSPVPKLNNIPPKFHVLASGLDGVSLCDYFVKFLTCYGFTPSDSIEDSLIIFDFIADPEHRRASFSRIPSDQVAICLVPSSEAKTTLEETPNNIVFVNGPFFTPTMSSTLEEVDKLLSVIKACQESQVQPDEHSVTLSKINEATSKDEAMSTNGGVCTDERTSIGEALNIIGKAKFLADSLHSMEAAPPPIDNPVNTSLDAIVLSTGQLALAESNIALPSFPDHTSTPRPTALLVDDNAINLRIMEMYCRKRGLPYVCAVNGQQAVELFLEHQSLSTSGERSAIQLILMDLQMPVCDGIEATRQIRLLEKQNDWGESIVFIVTGQDSLADRAAADEAGAKGYFVKPVSVKLLDSGVKQYFPAFEPQNKA